jgi:hypothetical protein
MNYKFDPEQKPYKNNDAVIIHSIGDGKHYRGVIKGISVDHNAFNKIHPASIYIIEAFDKIDPTYSFDHIAMPAACLCFDDGSMI